ncbi:MAG: hypothetical protein IJ773_04245 [Lachnospiraceae bacterium]|nr:hypothetical protein [Lachnospiraceae bacterium]
MKKTLSMFLALIMLVNAFSIGSLAEAEEKTGFAEELEERYLNPDIVYRTEVRWWMAEGAHTDETLLEEVQAIYDAGFRGIELCQLSVNSLDAKTYGYGSEQWDHDFHLVLNKCLELGMTVGLTSGTNWSTANYPGLDPDSQAANQAVIYSSESLAAGESRSGDIPLYTLSVNSWTGETSQVDMREKASFIAAYAYKLASSGNETSAIEVDGASIIDLSERVVLDEARHNGTLEWTAPDDGDYVVMYYYMQGTAQSSSPAVDTSYCINYFDKAGLEGLKAYWLEHVLNDEELNAKIAAGDVQLFMDSLEYNTGNGFLNWTQDFAEEFESRKGYDIRPYLILGIGLPQPKGIDAGPEVYGTYNLTDADLGQRILNDYHDVLTELYMENLMIPFRDWLHEYGITLRAQISYGKYLEISEPSLTVDYPEIENLNQANQVDMYRTLSGAAHLQNKVMSSETSAHGSYSYVYDYQTWMQEAYMLYAAGVSRINWHIWTSQWAPQSVEVDWPGFRSQSSFNVLSLREPGYSDFDEFNNHMGRVQQLLREGKSRTDVGMLHMKYGELILAPSKARTQIHQNWLLRHENIPGYFQSYGLQDKGYTYDYFSPEFLFADDVYYNAETGTLEQAGYKAVVLYEDWLTVEGANKLYELAKEGLKVVVVDGAAVQTPYNDGKDEELLSVIASMKELDNVAAAASDDEVDEALEALGVTPYAAYAKENEQLLSQVRQDGDDMYLYLYNYCPDLYCGEDHVSGSGHGTNIATEVAMDGIFVPYQIDAWTGEVTELAAYRYEDGKTIIPVSLDYGNVALYAFEGVEEEKIHAETTNAAFAYAGEEGIVLRAVESGELKATLSDGSEFTASVTVPEAYEITDWKATIESWTPGEEIFRKETIAGVETTEHNFDTVKTPVEVSLETLTTWDNIPEVGAAVSGKGYYTATFNWTGEADGACIDFGSVVQSMQVTVNGTRIPAVNLNKPVVDISALLVDGENTIEVEYSSNLTNVQLDRGVLKEQENTGNWEGYDVEYRSYGLAQATILPYVEVTVE